MSRLPRRHPPQPGESLPQLIDALDLLDNPEARRELRAMVREDELGCRFQAKRFQVARGISDGLAKFGGGSLLTTTIALILGGQLGWPVIGIALLTLLSFVTGTMLSAFFEYRAAAWEHEADRLAAALSQTKE